jgi:hypothetical protein
VVQVVSDPVEYGAALAFENRRERKMPHLGRLELRTLYDDALAAPLRSVLD